MGIQPKVKKPSGFVFKTCTQCAGTFGADNYTRTKSRFYPDGYLPMCNDCMAKLLKEEDFSWEIINKFCQYADIPFIPKEFEHFRELAGDQAFSKYAEAFLTDEYEGLDWGQYFQEFKKLKEVGMIEEELPLVAEEHIRKLQEKWGPYCKEDLHYLENLYAGINTTQNINSSLQKDQALKICRMSLEIDKKIQEGSDFDKLLNSYDKLVKAAEFTPKNAKNASDFDSAGELVVWLTKRGFKPHYYDGVTRDIVDSTMKNIQNFNQRLYVNESNIGDEISRRIESLKELQEYEKNNTYKEDDEYGLNRDYEDMDNFDNDGYEDLMAGIPNEFSAEI